MRYLVCSLICLTVFCLVSFQIVNTELLQLQSTFIISQDDNSTYGVAHGFRSCGGESTLLNWEAEACITPESVCEYPIDEITRKAKVSFIPSQNMEQLGLRIFSSENGGNSDLVLEVVLENSSVKAGQTYSLITLGAVSEGIKGMKSTSQVVLYRLVDDVIEICAEADFEVV